MTSEERANMAAMGLDDFTAAYLACALWASNDGSDENTGGDPLDKNFGIIDIDAGTLEVAKADCAKFQAENRADIEAGHDETGYNRFERAGYDFWLTRNHHGAGFWSSDGWPDGGERLTAASHAFPEYTLEPDGAGKITGYRG